MDTYKPTLAIYAIQDRNITDSPYYVHDHCLTLMQNGKVEKHLTLERVSRKKHDHKLYDQLYEVLKQENLLSPDNFDLVFVDNVVGRAMISTCGKFRFEGPISKTLKATIEPGRCWWLDHERDAYSINHELAHISSTLPFYGHFMENSLLIHFDGGGSLSNFSVWQYKNHHLVNLDYHWKFKYLSSFFNANAIVFGILGAKFIDQNSVPGKMMGLASYGKYNKAIEIWLQENDYFKHLWGKKSAFYSSVYENFNIRINQLNPENNFLQNFVATLQSIFIRKLIGELKHLQKKTNANYLYYTGGSALNIVANKAILESNIFHDIFIPPCTEDSGLSLGAASFVEWQKHGTIQLHNPYLNNWNIKTNIQTTLSDIPKIAELLLQNKVIGICNDMGEIGPRALGNRSIISLANSKYLANQVSMKHKGREWYRPVAPIMLEKNAQYFTNQKDIHHLADFMLMDFAIDETKQKEIEGVVHIDGTARIQTIRDEKQNPFMYHLLTKLDECYNVKAIINTSFNKKGEPIVHQPEDAIKSAKEMNLDAVVINGELRVVSCEL